MGRRNQPSVRAIPQPGLGVIGMAAFNFNGTVISNAQLDGCISSLAIVNTGTIDVFMYPPQKFYGFFAICSYATNASFVAFNSSASTPTVRTFRVQGVGVNPLAQTTPPLIHVTVLGFAN